jgi:hypothetical protein
MDQIRASRRKLTAPFQSFQQRLAMYALSAGAAGAGILCSAPAAEAKVVYTPAHVDVTIGEVPLDLNHDGINDFNLLVNGRTNGHSNSNYLSAVPAASGNRVWGHGGAGHWGRTIAFDLPPGATVGPKQEAAQPGGEKVLALLYSVRTTGGRSYGGFAGDWANDGQGVNGRYLGFAFTIDGETHFGWARLNVHFLVGALPKAILTGYAYETEPNKAIVTGNTQDAESAADPSVGLIAQGLPLMSPTIGALALGANGLSLWRRE